MIPVLTAAESKAADAAFVARTGLPSLLLMETAARALADAARRLRGERTGPVVVLTGPGNNGGDGWGAARWLAAWGVPVAVLPVAEPTTPDAIAMRDAARRWGVPLVDAIDGAGCVVDALFGTGLTRPLEPVFVAFVGEMARVGAPIVAADLPSGLDADTGRVHGVAVTADVTVCFGARKRGLYAGEGPARCGRVEVVDLGLPLGAAGARLVEADEVAGVWPRRAAADPKTRSGQVLVVAGSARMAGAAVLACRGALAGGAGLVTLVAPRGAWVRLGALPPEVMVVTGGEGDRWDGALPALDRYTAGVIGPGLGGGEALEGAALATVRELLAHDGRPWVVDADALVPGLGAAAGPRVLTPHAGEAARLLGRRPEDVERDRFQAVAELTRRGAVALLKGRFTLVGDGRGPISVNPTGGPSLATGGTGDVLAGLLGALLARGVPAAEAARAAAWVHGAAGDGLDEGALASDVAAAIPGVVAALRDIGAEGSSTAPGAAVTGP